VVYEAMCCRLDYDHMTTQSQNQTAQHVVLSLRPTGGFLAARKWKSRMA
jgi:hypothetical protein